jgi:hypothetical protein
LVLAQRVARMARQMYAWLPLFFTLVQPFTICSGVIFAV